MCKKSEDDVSTALPMDENPTKLSSSSSLGEPIAPPLGSPIRMKKCVSFCNIEIAAYPIQLGDNPVAAEGLPLSIGWDRDYTLTFRLEEYETTRPVPRSKDELWMPPKHRQEVLSRQGVTASEMLRTKKEMSRIKKSRTRSINNRKWDKFDQLLEDTTRKFKHLCPPLKKSSSSSSLSSPTRPQKPLLGLKKSASSASFSSLHGLSLNKLKHKSKTHDLDHSRSSLNSQELSVLMMSNTIDSTPSSSSTLKKNASFSSLEGISLNKPKKSKSMPKLNDLDSSRSMSLSTQDLLRLMTMDASETPTLELSDNNLEEVNVRVVEDANDDNVYDDGMLFF